MPASEIVLYYAALTLLSLFLVLRRRPRKGMLLRLRGTSRSLGQVEGETDSSPGIAGQTRPERFSHIQPAGERPLNVVFNYNGHSWDAYEVLGLPPGSSPEKVEQAFHEAARALNKSSRPLLEAAHQAIQAQWSSFKKAQG